MREETLGVGQAGSGKKEAGSPTTSSEEGEAGIELLATPSRPCLQQSTGSRRDAALRYLYLRPQPQGSRHPPHRASSYKMHAGLTSARKQVQHWSHQATRGN